MFGKMMDDCEAITDESLKMQFANACHAPSESHRSLMILPQIAGAISTDNPSGAGITNGMDTEA
jgi:hypothetical protein